jgi:DNA (cytosine-5)-methyltransferase 1
MTTNNLTAIDLFAGAGGFTEGATQAGLSVAYAANHWPAAVAIHHANHPGAIHACQDLNQVDPRTIPAHDILLASPACQGHSRARGKEKPHHDKLRSTAWAVVAVAECHRPRAVVVENVKEFGDWALFPAWLDALKALGYRPTVQVLNAADFGVPQARRRIFIVAGLGRELAVESPRLDHVPARSILDLNAGAWSPWKCEERIAMGKKPLVPDTLARIHAGRQQHGDRFLVAYYGNEQGGRSLDRPLGTITTGERFGVVDGDRYRMMIVPEMRRAMGFPDDYRLPSTKKEAVFMLGNAVPPPMAKGVLAQVRDQLTG